MHHAARACTAFSNCKRRRAHPGTGVKLARRTEQRPICRLCVLPHSRKLPKHLKQRIEPRGARLRFWRCRRPAGGSGAAAATPARNRAACCTMAAAAITRDNIRLLLASKKDVAKLAAVERLLAAAGGRMLCRLPRFILEMCRRLAVSTTAGRNCWKLVARLHSMYCVPLSAHVVLASVMYQPCSLLPLVPAEGQPDPAAAQVLGGLFVRIKYGEYELARVQQLAELKGKPALAVQVRLGVCCGQPA